MTGRDRPGSRLRLHLGCGKRYLPGFIHVDVDDHPHLDYRHAIERLPMFGDGTAELIYCCHALEYFDRAQALEVLREWRRVLEPGGVLRMAVPDFGALAAIYAQTGDLGRLLGPLYGRMAVRTPQGDAVLYHRTVYDEKSLEFLCKEAGFSAFRRYDWRQTVHGDFDDFSQAYIPHMDKQHGRLISLNVEAVKQGDAE